MHGKANLAGCEFLAGGGEMGALIRAHDWSATPLGPPECWPQSLRTTVSILLNSKHQMFMAWGPELISIYNDAYRPILGARLPGSLGRPFPEIWADIWPSICPLVETALSGEGTWSQDLPLVTFRNGYEETAYFSFSYSPIRDESGAIAGMFCACTETTREVNARLALREEQEHLHQLFEQAPGFMCVLRGPEHVFELANVSFLQVVGRRTLIGRPVREALPELEGQSFFERLDRVFSTGQSFIGDRLAIHVQREPGAPIEQRFVTFVYQPIKNPNGAVSGIFVEGSDVTDAIRAEEARETLARQLMEERSRLESLIENLPVGVSLIDHECRTLVMNSAFRRYRPDGVIPSQFSGEVEQWIGYDDQGRPLPKDQFPAARALRGELVTGIEFLHRTSGRTESWTRVSGVPLLNAEGEVRGAVAVIVDIDEIKRNEEHLRLLMNELNHRVKNTLATVQSIAAQTLRNAASTQEAKDALEGRLLALARVHDVLTRESWDGAGLYEIVAQAVEPYSSRGEDRLHLKGPQVRVPPRMALALAMALQELATNAVKYGALSNAMGEINITWGVDDTATPGRLMLRWEEIGGPPVQAPTRQGFGTRLIERSLAQDLAGEVWIALEPSGLVCTVNAPLHEA